jgi:hypothetical protein
MMGSQINGGGGGHVGPSSDMFNIFILTCGCQLCKAEEVETIITHRQKLNMYGNNRLKVVTKKWETGKHVAHFHKHKDEYLEQVHTFLGTHVLH